MANVIINGIAGKMGRLIAVLLFEEENTELVGGCEAFESEWIGKDLTDLFGSNYKGKINTAAKFDFSSVDLAIDFSAPKGTLEILTYLAKTKVALVSGTTGFSEDEMKKMQSYSKEIPILYSPNMSLGVNLIFDLLPKVTSSLSEDYDIEITEIHHRMKKDAPSGTAMKMGEIISQAREKKLDDVGVFGRKGKEQLRKRGEIGIHTLRGGDVVGEHTVSFVGLGERIEITHKAHSRETFARGAIWAAKFIIGKEPGWYTMKDVLMN